MEVSIEHRVKRQRSEVRGRRTEVRGRKSEIRRQKTEDRGQKEIRRQPPSPRGFGVPRGSEVGDQKTEDSEKSLEVGGALRLRLEVKGK